MSAWRVLPWVGLVASIAACGETPYAPITPFDAGFGPPPDVGFWGQDASADDAAPVDDAAMGDDAGPGADAATLDAGPGADAATLDAGPNADAATLDAGPNADAATLDAAPPDAGGPDGGVLTVSPALAELPLGGQVALEVVAAAGAAPTWSVDGIVGGDGTVGTIVPEADPRRATYTAPLDAPTLPVSRSVEVSLGTGTGVANVSLVYPQPSLTAVNPSRVSTGTNLQVDLTGAGFVTGTRVEVDGYTATASLGSWGALTVTLPNNVTRSPGTSTITVTNPSPGGGQASLPIAVLLTDVRIDPALPPNIATQFDNATVTARPARVPRITYPEDQAVAPRNFPAPQVSWTHPGSDVCRLRMRSATVEADTFVVVPNGATPQENTSVTHPAPLWTNVVASVSGRPHALTLEVACGSLVGAGSAATLANAEIFVSAPATYVVSQDATGGRIVYFSGLIEGLWRIDLGFGAAIGQPFAGPAASFPLNTTPQCLGCHSFSGDGSRMGYIADAVEWNVGVMSVSNGVPSISVPAASGAIGDWTSMHPTDDVLLSIDLTGRITLVNATNGQLISVVPTQAAGPFVTHPVWAPDGSMIAFVSGAAGVNGVADAAQGRIWTMPVTRAGTTYTFGPPNLVASPAATGGSAYYPAFSPDSQWILFSQAASGSSYDNLQARVWLVSADGTVGPVELANANQPFPNLSNSWPRWAPQIVGSRYWIVFNSQRPYGPYNGTGPQQLWVATLDTSRLPLDPSAPAVWLPGQEPFTGNLTAEWTVAY